MLHQCHLMLHYSLCHTMLWYDTNWYDVMIWCKMMRYDIIWTSNKRRPFWSLLFGTIPLTLACSDDLPQPADGSICATARFSTRARCIAGSARASTWCDPAGCPGSLAVGLGMSGFLGCQCRQNKWKPVGFSSLLSVEFIWFRRSWH